LARLLKSRGGISIGPGEELPYKAKEELTPEDSNSIHSKTFTTQQRRATLFEWHNILWQSHSYVVELGDDNSWRAIHETVRHGHPISTQILLNAGADFNALAGIDENGWSPLALSLPHDYVPTDL
jgi:ankyrin repeat protein